MQYTASEKDRAQTYRKHQPPTDRMSRVYVTPSGECFSKDEYLQEAAECNLYYSPSIGRWLVRGLGFCTIVYVVADWVCKF